MGLHGLDQLRSASNEWVSANLRKFEGLWGDNWRQRTEPASPPKAPPEGLPAPTYSSPPSAMPPSTPPSVSEPAGRRVSPAPSYP